jgi:uncharacterized membrane protein
MSLWSVVMFAVIEQKSSLTLNVNLLISSVGPFLTLLLCYLTIFVTCFKCLVIGLTIVLHLVILSKKSDAAIL